jgi:hypothetical protein
MGTQGKDRKKVQVMMLTLLVVVVATGCSVSVERQLKLQELRELAAGTPKFQDFEQVDYSDISKNDEAIVAYFYRSSATYQEVRAFYTTTLGSRGWVLSTEEPQTEWFVRSGDRLTFTKGNYVIHVEHVSAKESHWRFAVDYCWYADR